MKKLIAILVVMVVLAGVVFAATSETHNVYIDSEVLPVVPKFQVKLESHQALNAQEATVVAGYVTNDAQTPSAYTDGAAYHAEGDANDQTRQRVFSLEVGGTVTVGAYLVNNAKQVKTYTIEFSNGAFTGIKVQGSGADDIAPSIAAFSSVNADIDGIDAVTASTGSLTVPFTGTTVTDAEPNALKLGYATFTYVAHPEVDPGVYNANILVTIKTV